MGLFLLKLSAPAISLRRGFFGSSETGSALFQIALLAVAIGHCKAAAHERGGWNQQQQDAFVDRALPALRAGFDVVRTHRAALAESRRGRSKKDKGQDGEAEFHVRSEEHYIPEPPFRPAPGKRTGLKTGHYKSLSPRGKVATNTLFHQSRVINHQSLVLMHAQGDHALSVPKHEQRHDNETAHHGAHGQPLHQRYFVAQMHEEPDNQRSLDERQAQQDRQHLCGRHVLIGQINFDRSKDQQRAPYPEKLRFLMVALLFGDAFCDCNLNFVHWALAPRESWPTSDTRAGK